MTNPIISIHVPSNRLENLKKFFDHLQETANDQTSFEVLVNLDVGDTKMSTFLDDEKTNRKFIIKYINTFSGGFYNSWKPINDLLLITNPNVYFMTFLSDEFLFETKGWDDILKSYIGYYADNIFRLRASKFRFRNYLDVWECGFAPDSIAFYTKKWVDICGNWAPCFSSDAFQQCVSYYLFISDPFLKEQNNRDIPIPNLQFSGEGASIGLTGEKAKNRIRGGISAWLKLMSHEMQTEAKRRAMLLNANILMERHQNLQLTIVDDISNKKINILNPSQNLLFKNLPYSQSRIKFFIRNNIRKFKFLYYTGGGSETNMPNHFVHLRCFIKHYLAPKYQLAENIYNKLCSLKNIVRHFIARIIRLSSKIFWIAFTKKY